MNTRLRSLWDMLEIKAKPFVIAIEHLGQLTHALLDEEEGGEPGSASEVLHEPIVCLREAISALDLPGVEISLDRLLIELQKTPISKKMARKRVDELRGRIFDQLNDELLIPISRKDALLYSDLDPFGIEVRQRFAGAGEDICEAAKCLSVGRYTAAVFHLMRAMELALQTIAHKIGATYVDKHGVFLTWLVIATNVKTEIDKLPKSDPNKNRWYKVHAHFDSVGRAWRNETMHPKQTYTPDEAREVFAATKVFMTSLAPLI